MKRFYMLVWVALISIGSAHADTAASNTMTLARSGKSAYVIAVADDAIPAERTAAAQLQQYLQQVTGARFPVLSERDVKPAAAQILVGTGRRTKTLLPSQDWAALGADGLVIKTVGNSLILAGGRPRGSLYAVFKFLEDSVGCRWWTKTEKTIPSVKTLVIGAQNTVSVPAFEYREHFVSSMMESPELATIFGENGHYVHQDESWGGHYTILGWAHTFSKLLPPAKYFKQHPEWYSDPANGNLPCTVKSKMPDPAQTQICLSNKEAAEAMAVEALRWIAKNPSAGYISISQNDNTNFCRDAESLKVVEAEGTWAGPLLKFVNIVAGRIAEKYPNFKVDTLAYNDTEIAPKTIRPAPNVIVRLAPVGADFGHPFETAQGEERNVKIRDNLLRWSEISPQLFLWTYITNFWHTMMPQPNWDGLAPDLRFFARHKVRGAFLQADLFTNEVGDFPQLRAWLMSKLLWDPNQNQEHLTQEFLRGYYGDAAPYLKTYLDTIQQAYRDQNWVLSAFNADFSFLTLDALNNATCAFDAAQAAVANDPVLSQRVQRERLSLDLAWIYRYKILKREALHYGKPFLGPTDPQNAIEVFSAKAKAFNVRLYNESDSFDTGVERLRASYKNQQPKQTDFTMAHPSYDVITFVPKDFALSEKGTNTDIVSDPKADGQSVAYLKGAKGAWLLQNYLSGELDTWKPGKWRVYIVARAQLSADSKEGPGLDSGAFNFWTQKNAGLASVPLSSIPTDTYQPVDLGVFDLTGSMYLWFAPTGNASIDRIFVKQIVLVRQ